jgi:hypothetical protein
LGDHPDYGDYERAFFDQILFGVDVRTEWAALFKTLAGHYGLPAEILAAEALPAAACAAFMREDTSAFGRLRLWDYTERGLREYLSEVYRGYDGVQYANSRHWNYQSLLLSQVVGAYGRRVLDDDFEGISVINTANPDSIFIP